MTRDSDRKVAEAYFYEVLNQCDMDAADRIFAPDLVFHYPAGDLNGAEAVKAYIQVVRTALAHTRFNVTGLVAESGHVAARWSLEGMPKNVAVPGMTWFDIAGGRISEMWISFDPALFAS